MGALVNGVRILEGREPIEVSADFQAILQTIQPLFEAAVHGSSLHASPCERQSATGPKFDYKLRLFSGSSSGKALR